MKFAMQDSPDLAATLKTLEADSKRISPEARDLLSKALDQLEQFKQICTACADQLDEAASLRAGLMDSESKQQELQRQVRLTLSQVSQRLRNVCSA